MKFSKTIDRNAPDTVNLAGGPAYRESRNLEMLSIALTSFLEDSYYESSESTVERLRSLVRGAGDKKFAAQLALFARNEIGMRSVSHVIAAEVSKAVKGEQWVRRFLDRIVRRPDDMLEIVAYYIARFGRTVPNAMKKGFSKAFGRFDEYQLAKYRGEGHEVSLVDVVNLVHPTPTVGNREALRRLVKGELLRQDTWEDELSNAGRLFRGEELQAAKNEVWKRLLAGNKLGALALVKNLRNIARQCDMETVVLAAKKLADAGFIRQSLVMPWRLVQARQALADSPAAYDGVTVVDDEGVVNAKTVVLGRALELAADNAMANVPALGGNTCIMLDCSGSMLGASGRSKRTPYTIGTILAAGLARTFTDGTGSTREATRNYTRSTSPDTARFSSRKNRSSASPDGPKRSWK